ncbi:MAG TPA: hypothetical protein VFB21_17140 [Chthonomonadaceae bacterium]|nr:hypothetical protein [Chthonomonadaceae bacterium]
MVRHSIVRGILRGSILLTLSLSLSRAQAQSFTNPGFETGDFTGWTTEVTGPPGQTLGVAAVLPFDVVSGVSSPAASLTTGAGINNNFLNLTQSLTFANAGTLILTADVAATLVSPDVNTVATANFYVLVDGQLQTTSATGFLNFTGTQRGTVSATVSITQGTHEVGFALRNVSLDFPGTSSALVSYLDNARSEFTPVPAPNALLMALIGSLPGLGWLAHRRRA